MAAWRLQKVCDPTQNLDDFVAMIRIIDSCCHPADRTLWQCIIPVIKRNITYLLGKSEFKELLEDLPQLKFDLLALLSTAPTADDDMDPDDSTDLNVNRGSVRSHGRGRRLG